MYSNKENVNILTTLLVQYGVSHVVVCPGSRNAPLVHNFNECPDIECHPVTDERSAAFVALGIKLETGEPVAVCVTSGSALLNTLPGVAEASYQQQGIIVISADRPAEWIDQLDGQTLPQPGALGTFVSKTVSLPECKDDNERWHCRRLICEAMLELIRSHKSVHINVPITEPLFCFDTQELPAVKAVEPLMWNSQVGRDHVMQMINEAKKPMIVIGQMPRYSISEDTLQAISRSIVTISEPLSTDAPVTWLDDLLKTPDAMPLPDLIIYIGGTTISKKLRLFLRTVDDDCPVIMNNTELRLEDPTQHATHVLVGEPEQVLYELSEMIENDGNLSEFYQQWMSMMQEGDELGMKPSDKLMHEAVRRFEAYMKPDDRVFYANSTAVRLAARYARHFVYCNRGLNGIEGSLSTAVGASLVSEDNVYCVIGDLSFFYDQNALWNQQLKGNMRILLLNNGGGEIFKTLPGLSDSPALHDYIAASHPQTAVGACHQYGISRRVVSKQEDLEAAIKWLIEEKSNQPRLVEVGPTPAFPKGRGSEE